jgi:allophanate hydrolase subunit 2
MSISYVVRKNFGWFDGRAPKHIAKGAVLTVGKDDATITTLFQRGAQLAEQTAAEKAAAERLAIEQAAKAVKK